MRRRLVVALGAALLLAGCGGSGAGLTLYSGQHPLLTAQLVQAFQKQTGIKVSVRIGDGLVLADQLLQDGSRSSADVYLTENSPELENLQEHHLLRTLPSAVLDQIPARQSSPTGQWVGFALRVSALAYDPGLVSADRLPTSVLDLAQPQWKGKIALAPTDSDFPPLVSAVIATYGQSAAARWLAGLKRNGDLYQDDESVVAAVNRGNVAAGIINSYYWFRLRLELGGKAMQSSVYYFPNQNPGAVENISGAAILTSAPHVANAEAFVRFLVSPAAQAIISHSDDFEYPIRAGTPANPQLPSLAKIDPATYTPTKLGNDTLAVQLIQQAGLA